MNPIMKTKIKRQSIKIVINFENQNEIQPIIYDALAEILRNFSKANWHSRKAIGNSILEIEKVNCFFEEYREELINGNLCYVYPSKMNRKK